MQQCIRVSHLEICVVHYALCTVHSPLTRCIVPQLYCTSAQAVCMQQQAIPVDLHRRPSHASTQNSCPICRTLRHPKEARSSSWHIFRDQSTCSGWTSKAEKLTPSPGIVAGRMESGALACLCYCSLVHGRRSAIPDCPNSCLSTFL